MSLTTVVQGLIRHFGFQITRYPIRSPFERALTRVIEGEGVDLVVDVGAHIGEFGGFMREKVGYRGEMVSFEPNPECHAQLEQRAAADHRWNTIEAAAGEAPGRMELRISRRSTFSSLLEPSGDLEDHFGESLSLQGYRSVEVVRIDEAVRERYLDVAARRIFLKSDAQGYDRRVLAGVSTIMESVRAIQVELSVQPLYEGATPYHELLCDLDAAGFAPVAFAPVATEGNRIVDLDVLVIRRRNHGPHPRTETRPAAPGAR